MAANPRADSLLPTGTVTFLFTDIEGSTKLWEAHPDEMQVTLARHDALVRKAIVDANGYIFKTVGDAFCAAFAVAPDAVLAAVAAQRGIVAEPWAETTPIRVRIVLHTGAVETRDGDYFGPALNRAARLLATGHGGQALLSQTSYDLVRDTLPDGVTLRDLGAHQLKDLARPEQVYQLLHPDLRSDFPPIKSLSTHPNNLPQQLTTFIGREKEIAEIKTLQIRARLLTLTGSGGSGKTRLAVQVAAELLEQFPDGVWFVELAALADPVLVARTAASVLGVKEEAGRTITETLVEYLKPRRLLLVLDNCEHLVESCAKLTDALIRQCPGLKVLATSRETLGTAGEQTYRVPSLSLPDRRQTSTLQTLSTYESVRLFIDRALLVRADFAVTNQNAPALASVCCHLDGIPLAIELAAARVRTLSVEEIDGKLDHRFRLLTGGSRTALPRQQTLGSLIDWSYDLLHEPEKRLLQRLSVFAGGGAMAAVEQVCSGEGVAVGEVLDLLTSLSDKSLVLAEQRGGRSRYRMLETVRHYARERLAESGGGDAVRDRHRECFVVLAEEAEPKMKGPEQAAWLRRLDEEHENLRAALDWSLAAADSGAGLRLCGALHQFWLTRGHLAEGQEWCARFLDKGRGGARSRERAKVHNSAGTLAWYQGDFDSAKAQYEESLAIRRQSGDRIGVASTLSNLGRMTNEQGDSALARTYLDESLAISRETGDRWVMSNALNNLGLVAFDQGDFPGARTLYEECLAIKRELGDQVGTANALVNLGNVAIDEGDNPAARARYEECLAIMREVGNRVGIVTALNNLASMALGLGDYAAAGALYRECLEILRESGEKRLMPFSLAGMAAVAAGLGGPLRAARLWGAEAQFREKMGSPRAPNDRPEHARLLAAARAASKDDAMFDRAWQEGRALTIDQAIELALADVVARQ